MIDIDRCLSILLCLALLCGCNTRKEEKPQSTFEPLLGEIVNVPYNEMEYFGCDSSWTKEADYINLYVIDSMNCVSCMSNKMVFWKSYEQEMKEANPNCHFCLLVCGGGKAKEVVNKVIYYTRYEPHLYIDSTQSLHRQNPHLDVLPKNFSLLLDKERKIVLIGDPINNSTAKNNILKIIAPK